MSIKHIKVTLADIEEARRVLLEFLEPTPLMPNRWLSEKLGCKVFLKLENIQPIGSFKIRGATYKISKLSNAQQKRGVITASAGNHAQGVAWGALRFKTKATIVMPVNAPLNKVQNTKSLGAKVILYGEDYDQAYQHARKLSSQERLVFIPAYQDRYVIAGQGTIGLEIIDEIPDADIVIGSMGGGGLMSGVATAIKSLRPQVKIIGAQASGAKALVDSIKKGKLVELKTAYTFADGIKVRIPDLPMVHLLRPLLDEALHATDNAIVTAILTLLEKAKIVAEGAGALPLAILEQLPRKQVRNKKIVLIISGGNIDVNFLSRVIDKGLVACGRRLRINAYISDKPGSLSKLTQLIASQGANILQVIHDRDAPSVGINETSVELTLETRGPEHSQALMRALHKIVSKFEQI